MPKPSALPRPSSLFHRRHALTRRALCAGAALALGAAFTAARAETRVEFPVGTPAVPEQFDASGAGGPLHQSQSEHAIISQASLDALEIAIGRYAAIVDNGGWPEIPDVKGLQVGARNPAVILLRERLSITGDLGRTTGRRDVFDAFVSQAVRQFQRRNGLTPDGIVQGATLKALNVPAGERLQQMRANLERIREFLKGKPDRFIAVNIPAAELEAVDKGIVVSRHTTVVGRPERQTPVLESKVTQLNFSPFWHVPESIVIRDIMPRMQKDKTYLDSNLIRAYDKKTGKEVPTTSIDWFSDDPLSYQYRQDPGEDLNSLGAVKINFWNKHAVFLHDTPDKELFNEDYRAYSSGCVRVENIEQLITWLLKSQKRGEDWSRQRVEAIIRSGERLDVDMDVRIPLFMVYITAWANPDGTVHFRRDLYERDGVSRTAVTY